MSGLDGPRFAAIHEFKDPIDEFRTTAFGGSIDNEKYHADLRSLVLDEVIEESGFSVKLEDLHYHGKVLVR